MFNYNLKNEILMNVVDGLDLTDDQRSDVEGSYKYVGNWLDDSEVLKPYHPKIFAQGSFCFGTVVRPIGDEDYDIDAVCKLDSSALPKGPKLVKQMVGNRLKDNISIEYHLEKEGKRCWTLTYKKYHFDILPAVINPSEGCLSATNKDKITEQYSYTLTNPEEYGKWFLNIANRNMPTSYESRNVKNVPEFPHKKPLQKAIQLAKRHRDIYFNDNSSFSSDDKPISMIINTLFALSYDKGDDILDAISEFINDSNKFIVGSDGCWSIPNPTVKKENFAEKWNTNPQKARAYFAWFEQFTADSNELLQSKSIDAFLITLKKMVGNDIVNSVIMQMFPVFSNNISVDSISKIPFLCDYPFGFSNFLSKRQLEVTVSGKTFSNIYKKGTPCLPKNRDLVFTIDNNCRGQIYWQVVNTGKEAADKPDFRGSWDLDPKTRDSGNWSPTNYSHSEETLYTGNHFIRYIEVRNGTIVGQSDWFQVTIGE
jgi:hypothetical protein